MCSRGPGPQHLPRSERQLLHIISGRESERVEPVQQVWISLPSRRSGRSSRAIYEFDGASFGFDVGASIVVRGVETHMTEPTADDRDVDCEPACNSDQVRGEIGVQN